MKTAAPKRRRLMMRLKKRYCSCGTVTVTTASVVLPDESLAV
jgi:hypothetical protein